MDILTGLGACALVLGVTTLITWWRGRSVYPPGPRPWPIIGNLLDLGRQSKIFHVFDELRKQYGDIFTVHIGMVPTIVITSVDLVQEAFVRKQNEFAGRPHPFSSRIMSKNGKDIILGDFSPVWKQQRKIAQTAIRKFATGDTLALLTEQSAEKVFAILDAYATSRELLQPEQILSLQIYNITNAMILGKTCELDDPVLINFINKMQDIQENVGAGLPADAIPMLRYLPLQSHKKFIRAFDSWHKYIDQIYEERVKNFDENDVNDLVSHVIQTTKELELQEGKDALTGLTIDHFKMIIFDVFIAGNDTSRNTMLWCLLFLTAFPEVQRKIQQELDDVVGSGPITSEHHRQLPYSEAFLYEVLRIRPITPVAVPHKTTCDTNLGGYNIPAGTPVIASIWSIHMNETEWEDPRSFRPERFLDGQGKMLPRSPSWLPFSAGRRVCIGEALAKAELHLSLAHLVRRYSFWPPEGELMDVTLKESGQAVVPNTFQVLVTKRERETNEIG